MAKSKPRRNLEMPNCYGTWSDAAHYVAQCLTKQGCTPTEIGKELNTSYQNVNRNLSQGLPSSRPQKKKKVPTKSTREQKLRYSILKSIVREVVEKVGANGRIARRRKYQSAVSLGEEVVRRGAKPVSSRQINRDLKNLFPGDPFMARQRPKGPRRYPKDESARVKFAKDNKMEANDESLEWIFSDEKKATVQDGQVTFEYVQAGEAPSHRFDEQYPPCVHMWGAISKRWKKLVIFSANDKSIDQHIYVQDILTPNARHLQGANRRFVQDGAKAHTSYYALGELSLLGIHVVKEWPARSPDLNPIENVWALLMKRVQQHNPTTVEDLRYWLPIEFNKITKAEVQRYVDSFPKRLEEVIRVKGKTIRTNLR